MDESRLRQGPAGIRGSSGRTVPGPHPSAGTGETADQAASVDPPFGSRAGPLPGPGDRLADTFERRPGRFDREVGTGTPTALNNRLPPDSFPRFHLWSGRGGI